MLDLSFTEILARALAAIVILTALGTFVAGFARLLGDLGPTHDGRLAPNPFVQLDIFAIAAAVASFAGWVRPIAIDPATTRFGRAGPVLAALGGLAAILLLAHLLQFLLPLVAQTLPVSSGAFVASAIRTTTSIAAWTCLINLLPFPPLLGGYLLQAAAPALHKRLLRRWLWISVALAALLVLFGRSLLAPALGGLPAMLGAR